MSAKIIPFRPALAPEPPLAERLATRRAYRESCREVASRMIGEAFTQSWTNNPAARDIGLGDALPLFVAAMRRELRKSGLF